MNVVASRFVSVVKNIGQSTFALGGLFDRLFAKFVDFDILVSVVVVVSIVVVVIVIVNLDARDAVVGNHGFLGEWKRASVVEGFPDTRLGLLSTSIIVESGKVDFKSIRADWTNIVLLVHVNTIVIVVVVVVSSIVVVVIVSTFQLYSQGC